MTTFDISRHGMSFEVPFAVAVHKYMDEIGLGERSLICDIQIVDCRDMGDGIWHVGGEFV